MNLRGGKHTYSYIITPKSSLAAGMYITVTSPVAFPHSFLEDAKKYSRFVDHANGPEVCSYSKKVKGAKFDDLNGQTLTLRINGSNPFIRQVCSAIKKSGFDPTNIVGK